MVHTKVMQETAGWAFDGPAIGERVRIERERHGWSQRKLAGRSQVSHAYISHLEKGMYPRPGLEKLGRLASALDVPLDELLGVVRPVIVEHPSVEFGSRRDDFERLLRELFSLQVFDPVGVIALWADLPRAKQDAVADFIRWQASGVGDQEEERA